MLNHHLNQQIDPSQTRALSDPGLPQQRSAPSAPGYGDLTEELLNTPVWTDQMVANAGIPIQDYPLVSIGGGLGSFALADTLAIAGLAPGALAVLTNGDNPIRTYRYLAANSQIPPSERLRSDAGSTMDNIWGFPSYAFREAANARGFRDTLSPLWSVFSEPFGADYYTPKIGQVFDTLDREADRIQWPSMLHRGVVRLVRRRYGGGYLSILTPKAPQAGVGGAQGQAAQTGPQPKRIAYRSRHVHMAVGYPGVKFLPDLQAYRERYSDFSRVVNAYEPHDHVYEDLRRRPGVVVVRGSGIVASRILQRLLDDRERGLADTTVLHLFRNYVSGPQGSSITYRRPGENGWAYQAFNFPKAAWGGQLKAKLEQLDGPGRAELLRSMGGTNTAPRKSWKRQLQRGRQAGYYREFIGSVLSVEPGPEQTIITTLDQRAGPQISLAARFVIDATGLDSDITEHRLLADLLQHGGATRSAFGRLEVTPTFEVAGTRSEPGRLYASGSITLGGYYAGVDSFLGLQYAALAIADDLAGLGFVPKIGAMRSFAEWWRWFRHLPPKGFSA